MTTAVFPGSFDPPTNGHLSIIKRASKLFDKIDVAIAVNAAKQYLFSQEERYAMMAEIVKPFSNVSIHICNELIVQYAQKVGANVLLRGVRSIHDFSSEFDLSLMNNMLNPEIETLFIPTEQKYVVVRSSSIKELAQFHGDISNMVPPVVAKALKEKFMKKN
ncbi:MAG: pantetheine-phosphate adenylyltransferase [Treponema sp.]|nr:pantetheine-phosphate adenylyltransferase [Treponema sp.]